MPSIAQTKWRLHKDTYAPETRCRLHNIAGLHAAAVDSRKRPRTGICSKHAHDYFCPFEQVVSLVCIYKQRVPTWTIAIRSCVGVVKQPCGDGAVTELFGGAMLTFLVFFDCAPVCSEVI